MEIRNPKSAIQRTSAKGNPNCPFGSRLDLVLEISDFLGTWFFGFRISLTWISLIVFCLSGSLLFADDADTAVRQERMAAMRQRAEALQLQIGNRPELRRVRQEPLFRYSDAARTTTDGTLWFWERDGRPIAAACLFNDSREGFQWNYELVAMCDDSLTVDGRPGWSWKPEARQRRWIRIDDPVPAPTEAARLLQMKSLLSKFRADEDNMGDAVQLRLLPRQVHRYRAPTDDVEDGALFLFSFGTNPEVIVQIETIANKERYWQISFARLSAARLSVFRGDDKVWDADHVRSWNPRHEYFSHYGPDQVK